MSAGVLGFNFDELAQTVLKYWNLPEKVALAMEMPEMAGSQNPDEDDLLRLITGFSHELSTAVYRGDPARSMEAVRLLIRKFGNTLGLTQHDVEGVLKGAVKETKATFDAAFIPMDNLRLERQIELALHSHAGGVPGSGFPGAGASRDGGRGPLPRGSAGRNDGPGPDGPELRGLRSSTTCSTWHAGGYLPRRRISIAPFWPCLPRIARRWRGKLGVGREGSIALIECVPVSGFHTQRDPSLPVMIGRQSLFIEYARADGSAMRTRRSTMITGCGVSFGLLPIDDLEQG